jgi:ATP-binding cassette, subfamily B, bacterial RamB/AmfA
VGSNIDPTLATMARAYLSPPRLVILDEATCHLDPAAEAQAELAFTKRPGAPRETLRRCGSPISSGAQPRRPGMIDHVASTDVNRQIPRPASNMHLESAP